MPRIDEIPNNYKCLGTLVVAELALVQLLYLGLCQQLLLGRTGNRLPAEQPLMLRPKPCSNGASSGNPTEGLSESGRNLLPVGGGGLSISRCHARAAAKANQLLVARDFIPGRRRWLYMEQTSAADCAVIYLVSCAVCVCACCVADLLA